MSTQETEALYYTEPYTAEFTARVLDLDKDKKGVVLRLDRTAFYPEGGGQPADLGTIGGARVRDVRKKDGRILHYLESMPVNADGDELGQEEEVACVLDWQRRFDFMQQHTGQHLLSAVLYRDFGYPTVSVHQGSDVTTIEIEAETMEEEQILQVEDRVLALIGENRHVHTFHIDETAVSSYDLRRTPKISGSIRVVEIDGYDAVPCGGVHTATTGEVTVVRHVGTEKIRGRVRLAWKIGQRAVEDYREKTRIVSELVDLFSSPQHELFERIRSTSDELINLRREYGLLEQRTASLEAERLLSGLPGHGKGKTGQPGRVESGSGSPDLDGDENGDRAGGGKITVVTSSYSGESKDFMKNLADALLERGDIAFCATNRTEKGLQWIIALGEAAEEKIDFKAAAPGLLSPIEGKGGGKPPLRQGIAQKPEGVEEFFRAFRELFS